MPLDAAVWHLALCTGDGVRLGDIEVRAHAAVTVGELRAGIVEWLRWPLVSSSGEPVQYRLQCDSRPLRWTPSTPLCESGLREGDLLRIDLLGVDRAADAAGTDDRFMGHLAGTGVHVPLAPGILNLGSDSSCEVMLEGEGIAPRHAVIDCGGAGVAVEDMGTGAATRVNGERVDFRRLSHGDSLSLGTVSLSVSLHRRSRCAACEAFKGA